MGRHAGLALALLGMLVLVPGGCDLSGLLGDLVGQNYQDMTNDPGPDNNPTGSATPVIQASRLVLYPAESDPVDPPNQSTLSLQVPAGEEVTGIVWTIISAPSDTRDIGFRKDDGKLDDQMASAVVVLEASSSARPGPIVIKVDATYQGLPFTDSITISSEFRAALRVESIRRTPSDGPVYTYGKNTTYRVQFTYNASSIDTSDFTVVDEEGHSLAALLDVTMVSRTLGNWVDVTVSARPTMLVRKEVHLALATNATIYDAAGLLISSSTLYRDLPSIDNPNAADEGYDIDRSPVPVTVEQTPGQADPAKVSPILFTVTFSRAVTGFDSRGIALGGTPGATVGSVRREPDGRVYQVAVNVTQDGPVSVSVPAGVALDDADNPNQASTSADNAVVYDTTGPTIFISTPSVNLTSAGPVTYTVTYYSADTITLAATDIVLNKTGTANGSVAVAGSGPVRTVTVSKITGNGTLGITIPAGSAADMAGNHAAAATSDTFTVDNEGPTLTISGPSVSHTSAGPVDYTVTYTDADPAHISLNAKDVTVVTTGSANGLVAVAGSGSTRTVTVSSITGDGKLSILIYAGTAWDDAGNKTPAVGADEDSDWVQVENALPMTTTVAAQAGQQDPATGGSVNFTVTFSHKVKASLFADPDHPEFMVIVGGTAGASTAAITHAVASGDPDYMRIFNVALSGMTQEGTVTLRVPGGAVTDDAERLNIASNVVSITYLPVPFSVTVAPSAGQDDPTNGAPINFTVTFIRPLNNPADFTTDNSKVLVVNGIAAAPVDTGDHKVYTVAVTPAGEGAVTLTVPANKVQDKAGNPNTASAPASVVYDTVHPTLQTVVPAEGATVTDTLPSVVVTFTESVQNVAAANLTVNGSPATTVTGSGAGPYTFSGYAAAGEGTVTVVLAIGLIEDSAHNAFAGDTWTYSKDTVHPTVQTVVPAKGATVTDDLASVVVTFTEPVQNVAAANLTVNGSPATSITGSGAGAYTFSGYAVPADGTVTVVLAAGSIADLAGNPFAGDTWTYTKDTVHPTVTVTRVGPSPTNADTVQFAVEFSEPVTGFDDGGVNVDLPGTTVAVADVSATQYTVTISGITGGGLMTVTVKVGAAQDAAGNANTATSSDSVNIDQAAPTLLSVAKPLSQPDPTKASPITFTVTFDGAVSGFTSEDVTVGGTAGATTPAVSGGPVTYNVAVSGMTQEGTVNISVAAGVASDSAGNASTGSGTSPDVTYLTPDGLTVTINQAVSQADPTNASPIHFTATFSRDVTDFDETDVTVAGMAGTVTVLVSPAPAPNDKKVYDVAVSGMANDETVTVSIDADVAHDDAGNPNQASTSADNEVTYHTVAPTIKTLFPAAGASIQGVIQVSVLFDEPVEGVALGSLDVGGTTALLPLTGSGAGPYTFIGFSPFPDGQIAVKMLAPGIQDLAGNAFVEETWTYTKDTLVPTVTVEQAATQADPANASPIHFTVTFSEDVTNFDASDLVIGGMAGVPVPAITGGPDVYDVAISGMAHGETVSLAVKPAAVIDKAGNANLGSTSVDNLVTYDAVAPAVQAVTPAKGATVTDALASVVVTFTEPVTGVAAANLTVNGSPATSVTESGVGEYTFSGYAPAGEGTVTVVLATGLIEDSAHNAFASDTWTYTKDTVHPTVQAVVPAKGATVTDALASVVVTFTEPVTGVAAANLTVNGSPATSVTESGVGEYTFSGYAAAGEGTVTVVLAAASIADLAGNAFAGDTWTYSKDTVHPTVQTVVPAKGATVTDDLASVAVTFTEPVTGVAAANLTVNGSPATSVTESGVGEYTFGGYAAAGEGTVTVVLAAGSIADLAGNAFAGDTWTYSKDTVHPTVQTVVPAKGATVTDDLASVVVTFSEPVQNVAAANLTVNGSPATSVTESGVGEYTFSGYAAAGEGTVTVVLAAGSIADLAGNAFAGDTWTYSKDTVHPTVQSVAPAEGATVTDDLASVAVTFTEPVQNVAAANLTVDGSPATSVTGSGAGPYTFSGYAAAGEGTVTVVLAAGSIADLAGNAFAGDTWTYSKDTVHPAVQAVVPAKGATVTDSLASVVVTFSEPVQNVAAANLTVNGSPATSVTESGVGEYTFSGYAAAGEGTVTVVLAAGSIADLAGNAFAGDTWTYSKDTVHPTATISLYDGQDNAAGDLPIFFRVEFDDAVVDFSAAKVAVTGGAGATTCTVIDDPLGDEGYDYVVIVNTVLANGAVTIAVSNVHDGAGNANTSTIVDDTVDYTSPLTLPNGAVTVDAVDKTLIYVVFSDGTADLNPATTDVVARYKLTGGYTVQSATLQADNHTVHVVLDAPLAADETFTIDTPGNIRDMNGNPLSSYGGQLIDATP